MQKKDMIEVVNAINGLCDLYGKTKLTAPAIEHWWESIKEFPLHDVLLVLNSWARDNSKHPTPHDVWERLNTMRTHQLEERAEYEAKMNRSTIEWKPNEYGRQMLKEIKQMLGYSK